MLGRIADLTLERLESAAHDVRLAESKLSGKLLQPAPLPAIQINLNGLAHAFRSCFMIICHALMILIHDKARKPIGC